MHLYKRSFWCVSRLCVLLYIISWNGFCAVQPVSASAAHILGEVCREKQEAAVPLVRLFLQFGKIVPFVSAIAKAEVNRTQWVKHLSHICMSAVISFYWKNSSYRSELGVQARTVQVPVPGHAGKGTGYTGKSDRQVNWLTYVHTRYYIHLYIMYILHYIHLLYTY